MEHKLKSDLSDHMKDFGLHMIGKGLVNATFSEMLNPYNHAMAIVHIAHGMELIIKTRIVEQHPLLIFSKIPKSTSFKDAKFNINDLLEKGQSIMYSELPEKLWICTGYQMPDIELYNYFGNIRNQIVHIAIPDIELSDLALKYGFGLVEKMVNEWWDETLIDYACNYDDDYHNYVFEQLDRLNISINYRLDGKYGIEKIKTVS